MSYKANWDAVTQTRNRINLPPGTIIQYDYDDNRGNTYDGRNTETPNFGEPAYGSRINGTLIARAPGYIQSDRLSQTLYVNRLTLNPCSTMISRLANPGVASCQFSFVDEEPERVNISLSNPSSGTSIIGDFDRPTLPGGWSWNLLDGEYFLRLQRPSDGWPPAGSVFRVTLTVRDNPSPIGVPSLQSSSRITFTVVSGNNPPIIDNNITLELEENTTMNWDLSNLYVQDEDEPSLRYVLGDLDGDLSTGIIGNIFLSENGILSIFAQNPLFPLVVNTTHPFNFSVTDNVEQTSTSVGWSVRIITSETLANPENFQMSLS